MKGGISVYEYDYEIVNDSITSGFLVGFFIILLALGIFGIVCSWKIYAKAGQPGWGALIPIYNVYLLFKITWGNGWYFLLTLIPIASMIIAILTQVKLAKVFGKDGGFAVGLIFLGFIFLPILAFDKSEYVGLPQQ